MHSKDTNRNSTETSEAVDHGEYRRPQVTKLGGLDKLNASYYSGDYKDSSGWWEYYAS